VTLTGCNSNKNEMYDAQSFAMGTVLIQKVYGEKGQAAMDEVNEKMKSLEELLTFNAPEGDIYKLNENAGKQNVELHPETLEIIKKALQIAELSNGAFDITIGPLVKSWGIGTKDENIPSGDVLQNIMPLINYKDLYIDQNTVGLKRVGQMVDLGGIAKGYAGDAAIQIYKKYGIHSAFISIGGNVVTLGSKPDGSPWTVGIRNPRPKGSQTQSEQIVGYVTVVDQAVTTAGDDQRYFEKNGQRYFHILNPKTGYPAQSGLMSVTLVTKSSFDADALDTAIFILGLEKGQELLRQYGGVEAVFITTDKKIYVTDGLKGNFKFQDASNEYQYIE
jgi:Membrane-associated lipoprotein involved in thiamine biosynthesis